MPFTKTDLLKNLRRIQKALCAYQSSKFCDCKYMKDSDADSTICSLHENGSGCPEVREAIDLIEKIPDWDLHIYTSTNKRKKNRNLLEECILWLEITVVLNACHVLQNRERQNCVRFVLENAKFVKQNIKVESDYSKFNIS